MKISKRLRAYHDRGNLNSTAKAQASNWFAGDGRLLPFS